MKGFLSARARALALALVVLVVPLRASAQQATTGSITGTVADTSGAVLPGANVVAVHEPTGTRYETVTGSDGTFQILNVRVGGPYTVTASLSGFKDQQQTALAVRLGEATQVQLALELATLAETVNVTGESALINTSRAGAAGSVPPQAIQTLPTIARNLTDFVRVNPYFNQTAQNAGPSVVSVAGRNNRYNNVQIDGAVNNDVFGLADSGTPGGQTDAQPISLDAVQEVQLVVSPYDVRQGGFSGGGVNVITKSGANRYSGSAYYFGRNDKLVGDDPNGKALGKFDDKQFGGSLGGFVKKDRAFFFTNLDYGRRDTPSGFSIAGTGQNFGRQAEAERFRSILMNKYGYDPGTLDEFSRTTNNDKFFLRGDFNVTPRNQLVLRYNYIDGTNDIGTPTTTSYLFPDAFYRFRDKTHSFVGQLNSTFGQGVYNEARVTYQRVRDNRDGPTRFPSVTVNVSNGGRFVAGTEQFSTANRLDEDVLEINDDLTFVKGRHTITVGTHNEFFRFTNLFIRDNFGTYTFNSLDLFDQGLAQAFDYSFSTTGDPQQAAKFGVNQLGVYAGDQWRIAPRLTLTYGLRVDRPFFPDTPTANPAALATYGFATDVVPKSTSWSPRAGFNYVLPGESRSQIRGGIGLFSGRTPYVWLSNQYGNTGIEFKRLRVSFNPSNMIPFVADPNGQPTTVGSAATNEIDLVDPDYQFPSSIRANIAYERELPWQMVGSVELLYGSNVHDIKYENLNLVQVGTQPDGRPLFGRFNPTFSDVIFLTNTGEGSQWSIATKIDRPFTNGLYFGGSYIYGRANSIMDGTSSQAASNWGNVYVPGDPNNPPVTVSNFDLRHRITLYASKDFTFGHGLRLNTSLYYNGQTGRPYGATFNSSDVNGDGRTANDLLYVPASENDVIITGGTWADFERYINGDEALAPFKGGIAERNAARSPWVNSLDFHTAFGVPVSTTRVEFTADVLNLLNLFDTNSGYVQYVTFNQLQPVRFLGVDQATGKMRYDVSGINNAKFTRDDLRSRWQAQFGVRVRF